MLFITHPIIVLAREPQPGGARAALWNWARGEKKALELSAWAAEPAFPFWPLIRVCLQEFPPPLMPAAGQALLLPLTCGLGQPAEAGLQDMFLFRLLGPASGPW